MKFGKLPSIDLVDFSLPTNPASNKAVLDRMPKRKGKANLFVGCTGWSMKEVRHESWFQNLNPLIDLLEQYNKPAVITDVAGRRDVLGRLFYKKS